MSAATCDWCGQPIKAVPQNVNKRFCSSRCRQHFHDGCRLAGKAMLDAGTLSMDDLRRHVPAGS